MPEEQLQVTQNLRGSSSYLCKTKNLESSWYGPYWSLPETPRGNKYIATLTGYFSKWAEAAPLQNKSALGVAKFIYSISELCMTVHIRTFISCTESLACMDIVFCIGHM